MYYLMLEGIFDSLVILVVLHEYPETNIVFQLNIKRNPAKNVNSWIRREIIDDRAVTFFDVIFFSFFAKTNITDR